MIEVLIGKLAFNLNFQWLPPNFIIWICYRREPGAA